jgi:hypothetical protein
MIQLTPMQPATKRCLIFPHFLDCWHAAFLSSKYNFTNPLSIKPNAYV